ncbi:MAG: hypothetical protein ACK5YR_15025 [Pirellula sp.]
MLPNSNIAFNVSIIQIADWSNRLKLQITTNANGKAANAYRDCEFKQILYLCMESGTLMAKKKKRRSHQ